MSHVQHLWHIVFRTKYSAPTIPEEHEEVLYRYIWRLCKIRKCVLYRINGMPDHIHLCVELPPTLSISQFVQQIKTSSHTFLKEQSELFPDFYAWSKGYCALTYSGRDKEMIVNYVKRQKVHHKESTFMDEIRALLRESGVKFDEAFLERNI